MAFHNLQRLREGLRKLVQSRRSTGNAGKTGKSATAATSKPSTAKPVKPVRFQGPGRAPVEVVAGDPGTGSRNWTFPPIRVESSNLDSVAYDYDGRRLEIRFRGESNPYREIKPGGTYHYDEVPFRVYQELMRAPSKGKYFHAKIRDKYEFTRME